MALVPHLKGKLKIPVVGAPLFIVSGPELVISQCKAGVVGSFPALNARPQEVLDEWLIQIKEELDKHNKENPDSPAAPFAVNQICHASNDRLMQDMESCVKHEVPIIITSLRPPLEIVEAAHSYGGVVFHDVISTRHAQKAVEQGVDGLILVCAGAGGHAGALSPFALLRETREWYDGTILLSGSISDGFSVASAIAMGADLAYIGTRFIATQESEADDDYKNMLIQSAAKDVVYTNYFSGVHGNYLSPSVERAGMDPLNLPEADKTKMNFNSGGNASAKVWKDIYGSGQGINSIKDSPKVEDLVDEMKTEFIPQVIKEMSTISVGGNKLMPYEIVLKDFKSKEVRRFRSAIDQQQSDQFRYIDYNNTLADAQPSLISIRVRFAGKPDRLADKLMGILDSQQVDFKEPKVAPELKDIVIEKVKGEE